MDSIQNLQSLTWLHRWAPSATEYAERLFLDVQSEIVLDFRHQLPYQLSRCSVMKATCVAPQLSALLGALIAPFQHHTSQK